MSRMRGRSVSPGEAFQNNLGAGAAIGAGAYVVNYILMYVFVILDDAAPSDSETWKFVGNILYNSQFVSSETSGGGISVSLNYVTGESSLGSLGEFESVVGDTIPAFIYHLAPIIVLVVAGVIAAQQAHSRLEGASAAAAGASIVPGVAVLAVVGTFLFSFSEEGSSASFGPELVMGVLLVGIVIPAIGGAIGGVLSDQL